MYCINPNTPQYQEILKEVGNPLTANEIYRQRYLKDGVDELFEQNFKLSSIGTREEYSSYLDTIFPDSQVKDIVYHGSSNKIEKFNKDFIGKNENVLGVNGIYLAVDKINAENYIMDSKGKKVSEGLHFTVININNPLVVESGEKPFEKLYTLDRVAFDNDYNNAKKLSSIEVTAELESRGFDAVYNKMNDWQSSYVVFEPEQIHILGSEEDIRMFQEYLENQRVEEKRLTPEKMELLSMARETLSEEEVSIVENLLNGDVNFTDMSNFTCS
jgi:hypothetical protein